MVQFNLQGARPGLFGSQRFAQANPAIQRLAQLQIPQQMQQPRRRGVRGLIGGLANRLLGERDGTNFGDRLQIAGLIAQGEPGAAAALQQQFRDREDQRQEQMREELLQRQQQQAEQQRLAGQAQQLGMAPDQFALLPEETRTELINRRFAPERRDLPASVQEFQYAQQTPEFGAFLQQRRGPQTQINVGNDGAVIDPFQSAMAETEAEIFSGFFETSQNAARNLQQLGRLEELLEQAPSGAGGAMRLLAGEVGIQTEGLSELQAADALISSMVPQQRPPGSGTMSDADLRLFRSSLPRIINAPGGNELIVDTLRGIAEYDLQLGQIAQQAASGDITRREARERVNALQNPLNAYRQRTSEQAQDQEPTSFPAPGFADGVRIRGRSGETYVVRNGVAEPE